jgi:hypothetical protein
MIKRQQRLQRIANVAREFLAARTAADWLRSCQEADPSFGDQHGWEPKAGIDFCENMEATYIVRMYAEFEAGLRDYWKTHRKQTSHPKMVQLVRQLIPNQQFSQDIIDDADDVLFCPSRNRNLPSGELAAILSRRNIHDPATPSLYP